MAHKTCRFLKTHSRFTSWNSASRKSAGFLLKISHDFERIYFGSLILKHPFACCLCRLPFKDRFHAKHHCNPWGQHLNRRFHPRPRLGSDGPQVSILKSPASWWCVEVPFKHQRRILEAQRCLYWTNDISKTCRGCMHAGSRYWHSGMIWCIMVCWYVVYYRRKGELCLVWIYDWHVPHHPLTVRNHLSPPSVGRFLAASFCGAVFQPQGTVFKGNIWAVLGEYTDLDNPKNDWLEPETHIFQKKIRFQISISGPSSFSGTYEAPTIPPAVDGLLPFLWAVWCNEVLLREHLRPGAGYTDCTKQSSERMGWYCFIFPLSTIGIAKKDCIAAALLLT